MKLYSERRLLLTFICGPKAGGDFQLPQSSRSRFDHVEEICVLLRGGRGAFFRFKDVNTKCIHWASRVSAMKFRKFLGRFVALTSVEVFIWWDVT